MSDGKAPTSVDVARRAGVSQTTVSLVFRGGSKAAQISEPTRRKVQQAAQEIGYQPNHAARSLRQNRTDLIGLATTMYTNYSLGMIRAARRAAAEAGRQLVVLAAEDGAAEESALDQAARGSVDALIMSPRDKPTMTLAVETAAHGHPVILAGPRTSPSLSSVRLDLERAGRLATEHLVERGHRHIGYIAPNRTRRDGRLTGYRRVLREAGLAPADDAVVFGPHTPRGAFNAVRRLMETARPQPTALFVFNEEMAIGAMSALHSAGLSIPRDVAVVGCNESPSAEFLWPPLSSVALPGEDAGRLAVELAVALIDDPTAPARDIVLPPRLIVRESSVWRRATSRPPSPVS